MKAAGVCVVLLVAAASPATAADTLTALETRAACAVLPASALPRNGIRIVGGQALLRRHMYARDDRVVIDAGTNRGIQRDLRYYLRREPGRGSGLRLPMRGAATTGWLRIVSATETAAVGEIEFACDGIAAGDLLQPFAAPVMPPDANRPDRGGQANFDAAGRVLFGVDERTTAAAGDFMLVAARGLRPGVRLAIYRQGGGRLPPAAVGEAVVTSVHPDAAVVRVTESRDAISSGDLAAPRHP
jgi:hypothetical protein